MELEAKKNFIQGLLGAFALLGLVTVWFDFSKMTSVREAQAYALRAETASSDTNLAAKASSVLKTALPRVLEEEQGYQILLPASRLWLDTGIKVQEGDTATLRVSGGVSTALSQLILHELDQTPSPYPWKHFPADEISGPPTQRRHTQQLVCNKAGFRDLLMFNARDDNELSTVLRNPRAVGEDRVIIIAPANSRSWRDGEYEYKAPSAGTLCFILNDNYPTDVSHYLYSEQDAQKHVQQMQSIETLWGKKVKNAANSSTTLDPVFIARWALRFQFQPPSSLESFRQWETNKWQSIHSQPNNRIFYDDNIGACLIQIRLKRKVA